MRIFRIFVCLILFLQSCYLYETPKEYTLNLIESIPPDFVNDDTPPPQVFGAILSASYRFAADLFNNKTCPDFPNVLPNTKLVLNELFDYDTQAIGVKHMIDLGEQGESLVLGVLEDFVAIPAATVGNLYDMAILSSFAPSSLLGNKDEYPFFSRIYLSTSQEVDVLFEQLLYFAETNGRGWTDIALLGTTTPTSLEYSSRFFELAEKDPTINVAAFQQVLVDQEDASLEIDEIKKSGARIIISSVFLNFMSVLEQAGERGLIDENHVWFCASSSIATMSPSPFLQGMIAVQQKYVTGTPGEACYREAYAAADPNQYLGAGGPPPYGFIFSDQLNTIVTAAIAIDALDKQEMLNERIPAQVWSDTIRNVSFSSVSGPVSFLPNGDRVVDVEVLYCEVTEEDFFFIPFAVESEGSLTQLSDPVWFSGTTDVPDLDIRPPFHYWSCADGEKGFDETGKTISIHSPDGSDVDEIDIDYHCDTFIDCKNLSDERYDCSTNYVTIYTVFGIITVLLMLIVLFLFVFVIIFGIILKYQRVRVRSPSFLLILLCSLFVGYTSIFSFYGQPHPVACAFQPWLLGLPSVSMIVVLAAKNYRIYRIFLSPLQKVKVSDLRLFILWLVFFLPALFIVVLWMIISTPTADFVERGDQYHYVCVTGGFTGYPGGYVFFAIFVAYTALVLLFGAVISVLARNIHPLFNESKLLTISIYNLGFLAAVIIPVFLVVQPFNPFIAWILRTLAVLYAFTTTMAVQFAPIVFGVLFIDRMKNVQHSVTRASSSTASRSNLSQS